ncbi:hypothetical protein HYFRA_00012514 [Hymenoscyphus fraxineus]|uniref:ZW10 C-terminal helical domain-containing protein n=1 Tax=Hymenoscyphus fraxineus TaxID=746836 RepID=A0A9N9L2G9_9HELO|nr:hypothetical protein HYFRA_00012514 [Hymenoscyphus fraxineus]
MATPSIEARLTDSLIQFSANRQFPDEEEVSAAYVQSSVLPGALEALEEARKALETEIRQISQDSATDVDTWIAHAETIQHDIEASRRLASSIVRDAEADEERLEALKEQQKLVKFLESEVTFSEHVAHSLQYLQDMNDKLDKIESLAQERNVLEALSACKDYTASLFHAPDNTARAKKVLDARYNEISEFLHGQLQALYNYLVRCDKKTQTLTINNALPSEIMTLEQVIHALETYQEMEQAAAKLWEELDEIIIGPRTFLRLGNLPGIAIEKNTIVCGREHADLTIKSLFDDMQSIIGFLCDKLPKEFIKHLSDAMMPTLCERIKELWLDSAVPTSLDDLMEYQKALLQVSDFVKHLEELKWPGAWTLQEWVSTAAKNWLDKRKANALDWTRNQLSLGVGISRPADRIERRMVQRDEGMHIPAKGNVVNDDWDAAWDSGDDEHPKGSPKSTSPPPLKRHRSSIDEERKVSETTPAAIPTALEEEDEDDGADAWGWGDEDTTEPEPQEPSLPEPTPPSSESLTGEVREMIIKERYYTSSMPQPVFQTMTAIYEDAARLTRPEYVQMVYEESGLLTTTRNADSPITPAAPGLFTVAILILAMYRAISPTYYNNHDDGNMFLYNDAMWLADQLRQFSKDWAERKDLNDRIYGKLKLDPEIKVLESFGKRAYTNELISQRTALTDFLAGPQNFFQQDKSEIEHGAKVVARLIREKAKAWHKVLTWSACASAVGSLVNTIATKLITDIFDLPTIGVDDAALIAEILTLIEGLDDLFIKPPTAHASKNGKEESISLTAQFVDQWLKLNFLNQVLQSNLVDIRFLWRESDLSLYFQREEVVDLIKLSFENNEKVRGVIKEIMEGELPRGGD